VPRAHDATPGTASLDPHLPLGLYAREIAPQPDGYFGMTPHRSPDYDMRYDAQGVAVGGDPTPGRFTVHVAGIPHGGAVLVTYTPASSVSQQWLVWVSETGQDRAKTAVEFDVELLAVSTNGDTLAASNAGQARWYDANGAPETDWFPHGLGFPIQPSGEPVALADGSVVVGLTNGELVRFQPGVAAASAAPDWFLARPSATIAAVRGGAANAAATVKSGSADACDVEVEILTPAGESCGTVRLHAASACTAVTFGADRTVFTTGKTSGAEADGSSYIACAWHWWSGLLR
jgi:hypothetical protein